MREELIDLLTRIKLLRTNGDPDEDFDKLAILGDVARLCGATPEELGEALKRSAGMA